MTAIDHQRVREIFHAVCDLELEARSAYLDDVCADDAALRARLEALLKQDDNPNGLLADAAVESGFHLGTGPEQVTDGPIGNLPERIGRYRVLGPLGEGGMGVVYEAEQENPKRRVALKLMRSGLFSPAYLKRFELETHALGLLQHEGIAQIYEAGTVETPTGAQPYFAMELVSGESLIQFVRTHDLDIRERLVLFGRICDAVEHAHQKGVIHRDLKPGNILVNETGRPKILDFGVARLAEAEVTLGALQTQTGQLLGTLAYMSPEQVSGQTRAIDTRSDVYSLGVILYELLADQLPYDISDSSILEAGRVIQEEEPKSLSHVSRRLRGDLETICTVALEKEKERRYQSVGALAADVRRFLNDEPIQARPPSAAYQLRKFVKRNKAMVAGGSIAFAALLVGFVVSTAAFIGEARQRRHVEWQSDLANIAAADLALRQDNVIEALARLEAIPEARRAWEWHYLTRRTDQSLATLTDHNQSHNDIAVSRDGSLFATAAEDGTVGVWSAEELRLRHLIAAHEGPVRAVVFTPDAQRLFSSGEDGSIKEWDAGSGAWQRTIQCGPGKVRSIAFDATGARLAAIVSDHEASHVRVLDASTFQDISRFHIPGAGTLLSMDLSPDGRRVVVGSNQPGVRICDAGTGAVLHTLDAPTYDCRAVAWSNDGSRVIAAYQDNDIAIWNAETGALLRTLEGHTRKIWSLETSLDGELLVSSGADRTVRLWDIELGALLGTYSGHRHLARASALSADLQHILSADVGGLVRVWPFRGTKANLLGRHDSFVYATTFSPDGEIIASAGWDHMVRLWDAATGREIRSLSPPASESYGELVSLAFDPQGQRLAAGVYRSNHLVHIWDVESGELIQSITWPDNHGERVIAWSPDGSLIAVRLFLAYQQPAVGLFDADTGELVAQKRVDGPLFRAGALAFLRGGSLLAVSDNADIRYWEAPSLEERGRLAGGTAHIQALAHALDEDLLGVAYADGTIRLWRLDDASSTAVLTGHTGFVYALDFSPDGTRLVSGGDDTTIRLWDVARGDEVLKLTGHDSYVYSVDFSPDGSTIVSGSGDHTVRRWRR